jgi:hypothetical protein
MSDTAPNPGSDEAIKLGCKCPVLDNAHGRGYMGVAGTFVYVEGCPVHVFAFETNEPFVVTTPDLPQPQAPK